MPNVRVLWAHQLNFPWPGTYLDCRSCGVPRWADVRGVFNSWWGLKPKMQEVERLNPPTAMQWECCVCVSVVYWTLKYHSKIPFWSHHPLPKHKSSRWRRAWDVGCLSQTTGAASAVLCLSFPGDLGYRQRAMFRFHCCRNIRAVNFLGGYGHFI